MRFLFICFAFLALLGCSDRVEKKTVYITDTETEETTDGISYSLSGNIHKGPCFEDGDILIQPIDPITMEQTGVHFIGFTNDNLGSYKVPASMQELYAEVFFEGECHNEVSGGSGQQKLSGIIKASDLVNNINPPTKIRSIVARHLNELPDSSNDIEYNLIEAERLILDYLYMPVLDKRFTEMNLANAGLHDSVLLLINSMILTGRSEAEQGAYMVQIANGVINNDSALRQEIKDTIELMPLLPIIQNLKNRYTELGLNIGVPPFWELKAPAYYADLLGRDPVLIGTFNLDDNSTCSFDQNTYNTFAIPYVFDGAPGKYIALNLDGDISIWSKGVDRPSAKIIDITRMDEILLDDPVKLVYNGILPDNHGLVAGTEYYIVIRRDTDFTLITSCQGGFLPFGNKLASDDEGVTWIGTGNSTPWFIKSGVKMYTTN